MARRFFSSRVVELDKVARKEARRAARCVREHCLDETVNTSTPVAFAVVVQEGL